MKTKGGFTIENFKILEAPIEHGILEPHIYTGLAKNVPRTGDDSRDYLLTWDKFGRCSNFQREDCFIEVSEIETEEVNDSENLSELENFEMSLAQSMFHVLSDDIDSETGAKLEEVILLQHLAADPSILKYKSLKQFVEENTGKCYSADVKKRNDEVMEKQKNRT